MNLRIIGVSNFFSRILDHSLEYSAIHMNVLIFHWCIHRFQWDFESFIGVFNHSYECFDYPLMYPVFPMMFLIIHRGIQPFLMIFGSSICCWCNESSESQPFIDSTKGPSVLLLSVCHQEKETFCTHLYRWPMQRNIFDSIICEPSDRFIFFVCRCCLLLMMKHSPRD